MTMPVPPTPPVDPAQGQPPANPPAPPATPPAGPAEPPKDTTDWKAMARQWEARAKENKEAATELAALKASSMTEQEKAVAAAKVEGRTAGALENGMKLANAELRAAAAVKGVDLTDLGDLIDVRKFVNDKGEVDDAAIKQAVTKLAKVTGTKPAPPRGSGDFPGGTGAGQPITEDQFVAMSPEEKVAALEAGKLNHFL